MRQKLEQNFGDDQINLRRDCEEILRSLIANHAVLQRALNRNLTNVLGDNFETETTELLLDLVARLRDSDAIKIAFKTSDWGK